MHDLKFALRAFARTPGVSSLIVFTLGVAIAVAAIAFSTVDMVWHFIPSRSHRTAGLRGINRPKARAIAGRHGRWSGASRRVDTRTSSTGRRARTRSKSLRHSRSRAPCSQASTCRRASPRVQATRNLLDVWGITPQMGRTFAADEATPGRERVVVVSHTFWQRQLVGPTGRGRQRHLDRRPPAHDRRRAAADRRHRHFQDGRRRDADRARSRAQRARRSPAVCHRRAQARRRDRAGAKRTSPPSRASSRPTIRSPTRRPASSCARCSSCSARNITAVVYLLALIARHRVRASPARTSRASSSRRPRPAAASSRSARRSAPGACSRFGSS